MKRYLFTPGPTPVPPEVLAALGAPVVHHRSPDFRPIYERCLTRLRDVCRTESDVLLFTASGTGAFESAVVNLVSPGEPHLVVSAGSFGERWIAMTKAYGADVDELRYGWGETPDPDDVRARRPARRRASTSTGSGRARRSAHSMRRSRRRSRWSLHSTSRSASCSRRGSTRRSIGTYGSAVRLAPARRRWASSSSRRTRTAARSSPPSARRMPRRSSPGYATASASRSPAARAT